MPFPWTTGDKTLQLVSPRQPDKKARKLVASKQLRFRFAELVSTSEKMLELATEHSWEKLEELERFRQKKLQALGNYEHVRLDSPEITEAYQTLLQINDQIAALVMTGKRDLAEKFRSDKKADSAMKLYKSI